MNNKKKLLICGCTGFLGTNLVNHFRKLGNYDVYGVALKRQPKNLPEDKFFKIDLTNKEQVNNLFRNNDFDIVVQAAASTSGSKDILERPYIHVTDNALMNALILQACYDNDIEHFIFTSCGVMYNPDRTPVTEEDYHIEEDIFPNYYGVGWTKVYVEKLCNFYSRFNKTKHTVMRLSNAYGPHDKYDLEKSHFFGATITKVMQSQNNDDLVVWGDGLTERDLLHVDDVTNFIQKAIENQDSYYELYNVGYGNSFSVKKIVEMIIESSGKNLNIKHDLEKPSINTKLALVSDKAHRELGWKPEITIEQGIQKTIMWYKDNIGDT
jgi:nucleoside-diphosphate-sugar epimerase